jgi:pyruvate dehydrogenase E2 component (dihydrolipoamide acetyltransferase)
MSIAVVMPAAEPGMLEGTILEWLKKPGEPVGAGEPIARVETDTGEADVQSPAAGVLLRIDADVDQIVACGETIALIGEKGETA